MGAIVGIILAGGQARRMGGGDKCLRRLGADTILGHVTARARPQVAALALNANGDPARFAGFGLAVVADATDGFLGPLAGILAGIEWARAVRPDATHLASFAADSPFFPADLVARLAQASMAAGAPAACAASRGRRHPVFGLWPLAAGPALRRAIHAEGLRRVEEWADRAGAVQVDFPAGDVDPFFNVNRPQDLAVAEALLAAQA
jgi:molybdopterin-guanine dinucleotide biosynthesis protein A